MSMSRPIALVFGGTGTTGSSIVNGLLSLQNFNVKVASRPASANKPAIRDLRARGVDIVPLEVGRAQPSDLVQAMQGVDTVICAFGASQLGLQGHIVDAAKASGVKRFVPSDFGTPGKRGIRALHDIKLDVREYIQHEGLGYTFIDVGFWYQYNLPEVKKERAVASFLWEGARYLYNEGNVKTAYTDLRDIGQLVARVVADPKTLNRNVMIWGEEVTQQQILDTISEVSGHNLVPIPKTTTDLLELIAKCKAARSGVLAYWEYHHSMWILGENLVENAKRADMGSALDARELYPDYQVKSLREYAIEHFTD